MLSPEPLRHIAAALASREFERRAAGTAYKTALISAVVGAVVGAALAWAFGHL
jgi:uncharacterized membrane protein YoaK (UPF0700 family)